MERSTKLTVSQLINIFESDKTKISCTGELYWGNKETLKYLKTMDKNRIFQVMNSTITDNCLLIYN